MGGNMECGYTAIAKRRKNIPKTTKQRLAGEKQHGCLVTCREQQANWSNGNRSTGWWGWRSLTWWPWMEWSLYTMPLTLCGFCVCEWTPIRVICRQRGNTQDSSAAHITSQISPPRLYKLLQQMLLARKCFKSLPWVKPYVNHKVSFGKSRLETRWVI